MRPAPLCSLTIEVLVFQRWPCLLSSERDMWGRVTLLQVTGWRCVPPLAGLGLLSGEPSSKHELRALPQASPSPITWPWDVIRMPDKRPPHQGHLGCGKALGGQHRAGRAEPASLSSLHVSTRQEDSRPQAKENTLATRRLCCRFGLGLCSPRNCEK